MIREGLECAVNLQFCKMLKFFLKKLGNFFGIQSFLFIFAPLNGNLEHYNSFHGTVE